MRVAVVDIGTNSTRLLIADVDPSSGSVEELDRRSTVTRLGVGVDRSGRLSDEGMDRVFAALDRKTGRLPGADTASDRKQSGGVVALRDQCLGREH